jgi:hypothetical protein
MRTRCAGAAGVLAAVLTVFGCGGDSKTGEVTGAVTIDGQKPPVGSSITFVPADGKGPSAGAMLDDGRYTATVPVGVARVEIRAPKFAAEKTKGGPGGGGERVVGDLLPAKYHDNTELTFDVQAGRNEKNWELKSK